MEEKKNNGRDEKERERFGVRCEEGCEGEDELTHQTCVVFAYKLFPDKVGYRHMHVENGLWALTW